MSTYPEDPVVVSLDRPRATYTVPLDGPEFTKLVRAAVRAIPRLTLTSIDDASAHLGRRRLLTAGTAAVVLHFSHTRPGMTTIEGRVRPQRNSYASEAALRNFLVSLKREMQRLDPHE